MNFLIADTFTDSLSKLTRDEQKAVKTTAFDLQVNPARPGMKLHRIDRAKDSDFWSVRVSGDIRLIVHRTASTLMLCYTDHHDAAYKWAERRRLESHPKTGAAQIVEVREVVRDVEVPRFVVASEEEQVASAPPLAGCSDESLMSYGVPSEWLGEVRGASEDALLDIAEHLPAEAAEAVLELATGGTPERAAVAHAHDDPFLHPDAKRRFRVVADVEELERALASPWDKWAVFLHPAQQAVVERDYSGPARVSGSAGTGKTVVALHRVAHLARQNPGARILLTTFSEPLALMLRAKLNLLVGQDSPTAQGIAVASIDQVGLDVYASEHGDPTVVDEATVRALLKEASEAGEPHRFSDRFIEIEWHAVVDAWQLSSWEDYRDVQRLGRKTRIGEKQRKVLWAIFERVHSELERRRAVTMPRVFADAARVLAEPNKRPFDFAVVDEAQDLGVPQLRFLAALTDARENGLFFAGDLGQRIFQAPFSWLSLGVDVRGRSATLRINYRTSHQIRRQADRLLPPELSDVDGNAESRRGTISVFNGPKPVVEIAASAEEESGTVAEWLRERVAEDIPGGEMAVFVRSEAELARASAAVLEAGLEPCQLTSEPTADAGRVSVGIMHRAKGLEFRAVAVIACDDEVIPSQARIEAIADDADLEDVYNTERHLLYVACTRAREHLLVTGVEPASEFLDDLTAKK